MSRSSSHTGGSGSRHGMDGGSRQSRLLSRLFGRLRPDTRSNSGPLDKKYSLAFTTMSESSGESISNNEEDIEIPVSSASISTPNDESLAAKLDLRYGGQCLTPEQLPEFCDQLHHLVEVVRNIQSYGKITGEYPIELERRLEREAQEVSALAAEARNAREVVTRTRAQRRAVRAQRKQLVAHLAGLRETEVRELESTVRLSDRKLFKSWEALKDSSDPTVFEPLLEEIKNKQVALECLVRLIESRRSGLSRVPPQPLPAPGNLFSVNRDDSSLTNGSRKRDFSGRRVNKRRRRDREPHSEPLSGEPSRHRTDSTVLTESSAETRVGSAGAVTLTVDLSSPASVRDILFFTTN